MTVLRTIGSRLPLLAGGLLLGVALTRCMQLPPPATGAARSPAAAARPPVRLLFLAYARATDAGLLAGGTPQLSRLLQRAVVFPNAVTGQVADSPPVLYPALVSGRQPRHLPWQDELWRDRRGRVVPVGSLGARAMGEHLHRALGTASLPGLLAASSTAPVTVVASDPLAAAALAAGTVPWTAAADDAAVADRVLAAMADPRGWRAIFAGFGDVEGADAGLGRILDRLDVDRGGDDVLVVLVAARPAPTLRYLGRTPLGTPAVLAASLDAGCCVAGLAGASWRLWTKGRDPIALGKIVRQLKAAPEVTEIFAKYETDRSDQYVRVYRTKGLIEATGQSAPERGQELAAMQAAGPAPDLIVLRQLAADVLPGKAPSASPGLSLAFAAPGLTGLDRSPLARVTAPDVLPMVLRLMALPEPAGLDGTSHALDPVLSAKPARSPAPGTPPG